MDAWKLALQARLRERSLWFFIQINVLIAAFACPLVNITRLRKIEIDF